MGITKLCTCKHSMSDHALRQRDGIQVRTRCEWFDCICEEYAYDSMKVIARRKAITEPTSPLVKDHHREHFMGELREDGTVIQQ